MKKRYDETDGEIVFEDVSMAAALMVDYFDEKGGKAEGAGVPQGAGHPLPGYEGDRPEEKGQLRQDNTTLPQQENKNRAPRLPQQNRGAERPHKIPHQADLHPQHPQQKNRGVR